MNCFRNRISKLNAGISGKKKRLIKALCKLLTALVMQETIKVLNILKHMPWIITNAEESSALPPNTNEENLATAKSYSTHFFKPLA